MAALPSPGWDEQTVRGFGSSLSRAGVDELAKINAGQPARVLVEAIATGFDTVDALLGGGLRRKEITIVLADTGVNKTAFVEQMALYMERYRVAHFALEMGRPKTISRLLAKEMRLDVASVENLLAHRPDHLGLKRSLEHLCYERSLYVEDRSRSEAYWIDHLVACANDTHPDVVIIDDLQSIDGWTEGYPSVGSGRDYKPKVDALAVRSQIIDRIIDMADVLNCSVVIPHQTKFETMQKNRRPTLGDCADGMKLVRRADTVIALHRPFRGDPARDSVMEVIMRKNRNGPEITTHLYRNAKQLRFEEYTPDEERDLECCKPRKRAPRK